MTYQAFRDTSGAPSTSRGPRARWRWLVVVVYMLSIFVSSSRSDVLIPAGLSDKTAHGLAYSGLSAVIVWARADGDWRRVRLRTVILATVLATGYGLTDEVHQLLVPRRSFDWFDLLADAGGAFAAASAVWAWGILFRWRKRVYGV